ncbi:hypothetical protein [Mucilaginibacter dorajii]|uniref:Uncharacterized protein n=1 Tax=Mucilaginibacter dorajii TaxID=692994 RepID=A0ABP7P5G6_9SPHI|nr:hypothetical protein [Mucilaginibacter dorajii]MCS3734502.1 hypothetical protein [Mucilaginibacter dorajii]
MENSANKEEAKDSKSFKDSAYDKLKDIFLDNLIDDRAIKKTKSDKRLELIQALAIAGSDPAIYDSLSGNELDRNLKKQFGITFLVFTAVFTIASYSIIVLNAKYDWCISEKAIAALIIEIPIQFIGILYIVARNLFPNEKSSIGGLKEKKTN